MLKTRASDRRQAISTKNKGRASIANERIECDVSLRTSEPATKRVAVIEVPSKHCGEANRGADHSLSQKIL